MEKEKTVRVTHGGNDDCQGLNGGREEGRSHPLEGMRIPRITVDVSVLECWSQNISIVTGDCFTNLSKIAAADSSRCNLPVHLTPDNSSFSSFQ